ncbi:MAG: hypothetical protein OXH76_08810 [Boseongicola sp.]|nr:hypothetical protein [Boseongicola sp.]
MHSIASISPVSWLVILDLAPAVRIDSRSGMDASKLEEDMGRKPASHTSPPGMRAGFFT